MVAFSIWTLLCGEYSPFGLVLITNFVIIVNMFVINSFTPIRVRAGTKNSPPIGFYYRNSMESTVNPNTTRPTNIITMVVLFAPTTVWYLWIFPIRRG